MLMSRVAYDTETLHTLIYHMTSGLLLQSFQLVGIGVMLFYLNPRLAVVTMLPMPLILAGSWYFTRYLNPRHQHYWEAVGKQASALTGMLSGIRVVKAFVQEQREIRRFCQSSRRLCDSRQAVDTSTATFAALMGLLFALSGLAVWYIGGRNVLFGQMTLGSLMAFLAYLAMFYTPLTTIGESTAWFSSFLTTSRRIFEILDAPGESQEPSDEPRATGILPSHEVEQVAKGPGTRQIGNLPHGTGKMPVARGIEGRIRFESVWFGYDKSRPVLQDIDFTIESGEMIGVVGRSGSGKSTLVSLIGRLYEADAGRVLVDDVDIRTLPPRQLRRHLGMVPQEPFLFRGPVADNITYGNADAGPEQILLAARRADAHDFIMRMPFGYESQLGEGGLGLSGGERQRLSIARALLYDPAILILDEATASVDAESERAICEAIRRFARRRTTIVISHRLSTLRAADRLMVFDQGRLIEQGTHEELRASAGLYDALARMQGDVPEAARGLDAVGRPRGDAPPLDEALPWLDPASAWIEADGLGTLRLVGSRQTCGGVHAVRMFPAGYDREMISLRRRDASGREVEAGMIRTLDDWPVEAQKAVVQSLARRCLLNPIREIRQIRTAGSTLVLSVVTDAGPVRVQLDKPGEGYQAFGRTGMILFDAMENYYVIPDRGALPIRQQRLLSLYFGD
jgi:ATP-binding cassette subfamily B protein